MVKNLNVSGIKPGYTISQANVCLSAARPLNVERVTVDASIGPHDHDYYEVCLVARGRARHHTEEGTQELRAGSAVVIAPGRVHAFSAPRGLEVINLYYLAEWLAVNWREQWSERGLVPLFLAQAFFRRDWARRASVFALEARPAAAVAAELDDIRAELAAARPSLLLLKAALLKVLVRLSRACPEANGESFPPEIWRVMNAIERRVENGLPFAAQTVLQPAAVSSDRGSRRFRQITGLAPSEYFQRRRAQHAGVRLLDAERTVTEVALAMGYADAAHFSRLFRKYTGLSPRDYRRKYGVGAGA